MPVDRPPRLFAYGTLQPGRLRWPFLEPFAMACRPATVPGVLYDTGDGWPVATFDATATDVVPGTLVDLDPARLDDALAVLDDVEATPTNLLARITVSTCDGLAAWTYHCATPPPGMTRIPSWTSTDER